MPVEPSDPEESDRDLLHRAAAGDLEAFAAIYRRYQQIVYRFARAMTGSSDSAEDVTQEVFVGLIADITRYDPERAAFSTYLYGIVRNVSRDRLRRDRRALPIETIALVWHEESGAEDPLDRLENAQRAAVVRRALSRLPSRYRELIVLCDLHGLSYEEAALVVGASVGAVRSRLHRGRQLLRLRLARVAPERSRRHMNPARCAI
jgi:RNA polymerase sigma-70 factor (ECF subfamily)